MRVKKKLEKKKILFLKEFTDIVEQQNQQQKLHTTTINNSNSY